jgi:hypothetical protein
VIRADELRRREPVRRLAGRNRSKADLLVYRLDDREVAVKDYLSRPFLVRQTLGRFLIRHEAAAYRAADGVSGLPRFLGRLDPFSLATEWVDAKPLTRFERGSVAAGIFEQARRTLDELHGRGIAMADLHRGDVLVSDDGRAFLVDLATAWLLGRRPGRLRRALFRHFREQDLVALARIRAHFSEEGEEVAMAGVSPAALARHRRGRHIKRLVEVLRGRRRT